MVEADGTVYPCDFYVLDEFRLGNVHANTFEDMLDSAACREFESTGIVLLDECLGCEYYYICRAGCRRNREPIADGAPSLNVFCDAYRRFFAHALPRMQDIARKMPR